MNILIVEDRGSVSYYMQQALELRGHTILPAGTIWEAQRYWDQRNEQPIHCIIADLNMSAEGLSEEELAGTGDSTLAGWVWLKEYVYKNEPAMKSKTILYSEYLDALKEHLASHMSEWEAVYKVPKRGTNSSAEEVLGYVKRIADSMENAS